MLWDRGRWERAEGERDAARALRNGSLSFTLFGERLRGRWSLVRMGKGERNWLLVKAKDAFASGPQAIDAWTTSVASGRTMDEIAEGAARTRKATGSKTAATSSAPRPRAPAYEMPAGATRAALPRHVTVQLATLVATPPEGDGWLHEIKFDGYRLVATIERGHARLESRNATDWSERYDAIGAELSTLPVRQAIVDGELVALDADGLPDFQGLQHSPDRASLRLYLFDLLHLDGHDLRAAPLLERKRLLATIVAAHRAATPDARVEISEHFTGPGSVVLEAMCSRGLEGMISKRADGPYVGARTRDWVKAKCHLRQEFVVGGYSAPQGSRSGFGALLLGYYDGAKLVYCGRVGTGFSEETLTTLARRLAKSPRRECPFDPPPTRAERKDAHWVEPRLVAEVRFAQWTRDGRLRQPAFLGLREDKPARDVVREVPRDVAATTRPTATTRKKKSMTANAATPAPRITHPERVVFPEPGHTKRELVEYNALVAERMLPYLEGRPLALVRCPSGAEGPCFFQKHAGPALARAVDEAMTAKKLLVVREASQIVELAQRNTIEFHTWGSKASTIETPDRLVFDLDPGDGVPWNDVRRAATHLRTLLADLTIESFVQVSGGKGLHVVAPLSPPATWSELRTFAQAVAVAVATHDPERYVSVMTKAKRTGRIYIDYLRNGRGATSVCPYSVRVRSAAPVSLPIRWADLARITEPQPFTLGNVRRRLARLNDPWEGYFDVRQTLPSSKAVRHLRT